MPRRSLGTFLATGIATALALLPVGLTTSPAGSAEPTITPGVQMFTKRAQCTGNFVFTDAAGRLYVGYAAHCAGRGGATDTNGCRTRSHPLGTRVRFAQGADAVSAGTTVGRGRLAYSSWRTMRRLGISHDNLCLANDFALVKVGRRHVSKVDPTVPFWGGPTGLGDGAPAGTQVYSYGQSSLRPTTTLSPRAGVSMGRTHGGWGMDVYTVTPGIPGDSGSGFLDEEGRAVGTLSTVAIAPLAGSNGVGNLRRELRFARRHSGIDGLRLLRGSEAFSSLP